MKRIIIIFCTIFMLLLALFISNWEVVIDIDSLPAEIGYNEKIEIPKAYLRGKLFCRNGFEIDIIEESNNDFKSLLRLFLREQELIK